MTEQQQQSELPVHGLMDPLAPFVEGMTEGDGPSLLDGIGGGSIEAMVDAFHHYTDGLLDPFMPRRDDEEEELPTGLLPPQMLPPYEQELPSDIITGPKLGGDNEEEELPTGLLDPQMLPTYDDDPMPTPFAMPSVGLDMF